MSSQSLKLPEERIYFLVPLKESPGCSREPIRLLEIVVVEKRSKKRKELIYQCKRLEVAKLVGMRG